MGESLLKYVGNAFSPAMFKKEEGDILISIKTITEHQYRKAATHAKSVIGHPELAEYFDLPLNRETVYLKRGDILYIALPHRRHREGEIVRYGDGEKEPYDVENTQFIYKQVQVLEK